ncbi:MAG: hypothetical protein H6843_09410 [Rhodospirillaceae bacterium]|nr:hypothetical protein [Rhodospirillaceae bacterium]
MAEKFAYAVLGGVALTYVIALIAGMIVAWPFGIIGLVVLAAVGALFIKVLRDRLNNAEDDYYSRNVDK